MKTDFILHVDDDPNDVMLVGMAFRKINAGDFLKSLGDGEEAVAYLEKARIPAEQKQHPIPGLVLLDVKMPRKSGLEVLAWIRSQPELKRMPVVMLTSSDQPRDIAKSYELGANSYLIKPGGLDQLVEMVRTIHLYWLKLNVQPPAGGV